MITEFCKILGVSEADVLGISRTWNISSIRHLYWKLLSENGFTHEQIAQLNDKKRSSVTNALTSINGLIITNSRIADMWMKVRGIKR